jgi:hypothetical protein
MVYFPDFCKIVLRKYREDSKDLLNQAIFKVNGFEFCLKRLALGPLVHRKQNIVATINSVFFFSSLWCKDNHQRVKLIKVSLISSINNICSFMTKKNLDPCQAVTMLT